MVAEVKAAPQDGGVRLKQEISLLHGVCLIVGNMIGSGIFVSPKVRVSASRPAPKEANIKVQLTAFFDPSCRGCCSTPARLASRWWCGPLEGYSLCLERCAMLSWAPPSVNQEPLIPTFWKLLEDFWPLSGTSLLLSSTCGVKAFYFLTILTNYHLCCRLWTSLLIVEPACQAVIALTFSNYLVQPFYPTCSAPYQAVRLIAALIICEFLPFPPHPPAVGQCNRGILLSV